MSTQSLPASHSDAHGHEDHHPALQHHFAEMGQQFDTAKIGMWLFLATEILLFGGLFVGYGIMHMKHPEAFVSAHHHLDRVLGAVNTVVLLVSSWTMVMGVWAAKTNRQGLLKLMLAVTILLALVFLGVKYFEYGHKIHEGLLPKRPRRICVLQLLFHDDRPSRPAHRRRCGGTDLGADSRDEGPLRAGILHARRSRGALLAPGRSHLDLPVPADVPD
jgi:hypothetical protein